MPPKSTTQGATKTDGASTDGASTGNEETSTGFDLTVMDQTGARIPNAKAVLCRCKNHGTVTTTTDATGVAHFTGLKPGTYSVEIQAPGFKPSRQDLKLHAKKIDHLQVKLQVAPTSATVKVAAGAPVTVQGIVICVRRTPVQWLGAPGGSGRPAPLRR